MSFTNYNTPLNSYETVKPVIDDKTTLKYNRCNKKDRTYDEILDECSCDYSIQTEDNNWSSSSATKRRQANKFKKALDEAMASVEESKQKQTKEMDKLVNEFKETCSNFSANTKESIKANDNFYLINNNFMNLALKLEQELHKLENYNKNLEDFMKTFNCELNRNFVEHDTILQKEIDKLNVINKKIHELDKLSKDTKIDTTVNKLNETIDKLSKDTKIDTTVNKLNETITKLDEQIFNLCSLHQKTSISVKDQDKTLNIKDLDSHTSKLIMTVSQLDETRKQLSLIQMDNSSKLEQIINNQKEEINKLKQELEEIKKNQQETFEETLRKIIREEISIKLNKIEEASKEVDITSNKQEENITQSRGIFGYLFGK